MLQVLRRSDRKGDRLARSAGYVVTALAKTRAQGFGLRDPDFGGDFDEGRSTVDDRRQSVAVPIRLRLHVPGTLKITWSRRVHNRDRGVALLAGPAALAALGFAAMLTRAVPVSPDEISPAGG